MKPIYFLMALALPLQAGTLVCTVGCLYETSPNLRGSECEGYIVDIDSANKKAVGNHPGGTYVSKDRWGLSVVSIMGPFTSGWLPSEGAGMAMPAKKLPKYQFKGTVTRVAEPMPDDSSFKTTNVGCYYKEASSVRR